MSEKDASKLFKSKGMKLLSKEENTKMSIVEKQILQGKFFDALYMRNLGEIMNCLEKGADPDLKSSQYMSSPIHILAQRDDAVIGFHLINLCPNINLDARNQHGLTALHLSCMLNRPKFVHLLLSHEANPDVKDRFDKTPLHYAAENRHFVIIQQLITSKKVELNVMDCFENTPLSISLLSTREYGIAKALLQNGADMRLECQRNLHIFFECVLSCSGVQHIESVMLLLDWGVDINLLDERSGQNCLHYVALTGCLELAIVLVEKGANLSLNNKAHRTPAKVATDHGNLIVADYFRKGYRPPNLLTTLPLVILWSSKVKARLQEKREKEAEDLMAKTGKKKK